MFRHLKRHREFIGHVGTIISGRSISAVIGLLVTPIVARLFSPSDFGVAASFLAIAGIAAQVGTLRYETAFALPKDNSDALLLVALSSRILPIFCLLLLCLIALLKAASVSWRALELLGDWVWLLPLTVLMMSAQDIQESWLARNKLFGVISKSVVLETTLGGATRIGFGALGGTSVHGLVIGHLCGVMGRLLVQGRSQVATLKAAFERADWKRLREVARRYSDFPKLNAPAGLVYSTGQNLPVLMFGALYSPAVAGFFAMANRLARIPVLIVTNSMRRVFLQKAAAIHNRGRSLWRSLTLTMLGLLAIGVFPCAAVWFYGQPLLAWLLGDRWLSAGRYLEIIAPWVLIAWVAAPCNPIFIVLRRQNYWLALQTTLTIFRLSSFGIGYALDLGAERTLGLFVFAAVAGNLATISFALTLARCAPVSSVGRTDGN